jgi:hypothetical protein
LDPGAISVAITLGSARPKEAVDLTHLAVLGGMAIAGLFAVAVTIYVCYRFAELTFAALGEHGTNVLVRLSAFILLCWFDFEAPRSLQPSSSISTTLVEPVLLLTHRAFERRVFQAHPRLDAAQLSNWRICLRRAAMPIRWALSSRFVARHRADCSEPVEHTG